MIITLFRFVQNSDLTHIFPLLIIYKQKKASFYYIKLIFINNKLYYPRMSSSQSDTKLFPLKLPPNFHGPIKLKNKPRIFPRTSDAKQSNANTTPPQPSKGQSLPKKVPKLSAWQKRKSDHEINTINKFYIQHPSRSSGDNPEIFRNTLGFYRRSEHKYPSKDRNKYTVFGDEKPERDWSSTKFNLSSCKFHDSKPITLTWTTPNLSTSNKISFQNNITPTSNNNNSYLKPKEYRITDKIGSYQRKSAFKSPTIIKIGHPSIIDTYNIK